MSDTPAGLRGLRALELLLSAGSPLDAEDIRWLVQHAQVQEAALLSAKQELVRFSDDREVAKTLDTVEQVLLVGVGATPPATAVP